MDRHEKLPLIDDRTLLEAISEQCSISNLWLTGQSSKKVIRL